MVYQRFRRISTRNVNWNKLLSLKKVTNSRKCIRRRQVLYVVACMTLWVTVIIVSCCSSWIAPYLGLGDGSNIKNRHSSRTIYDPPSPSTSLLSLKRNDSRAIYDLPFASPSSLSLPPKSNQFTDTALLTSNNSTSSFQIANGTRYALVHVGKTAGSKIGCELIHKIRALKCDKDLDERIKKRDNPDSKQLRNRKKKETTT